MSVFPRTNLKALMQLYLFEVSSLSSAFVELPVQLVFSVSTSKFFSAFTRALHSALSVLRKVLLLGGRTGGPRRKEIVTAGGEEKSVQSLAEVKSLFHGTDCESYCLQG